MRDLTRLLGRLQAEKTATMSELTQNQLIPATVKQRTPGSPSKM